MQYLVVKQCSYGSLAAAAAEICGVRFTPQRCRGRRRPAWQLRAKSGPKQVQQSSVLFEHLVGAGEQRYWDRETESFCGLQVDY
jgi:hypothetical protein